MRQIKEVEENKQKFTEQYIDSIGNFKEVMFDAKRQNNINFASLKKIADNSLQMDTNRDIVSMLSMVRSVDVIYLFPFGECRDSGYDVWPLGWPAGKGNKAITLCRHAA